MPSAPCNTTSQARGVYASTLRRCSASPNKPIWCSRLPRNATFDTACSQIRWEDCAHLSMPPRGNCKREACLCVLLRCLLRTSSGERLHFPIEFPGRNTSEQANEPPVASNYLPYLTGALDKRLKMSQSIRIAVAISMARTLHGTHSPWHALSTARTLWQTFRFSLCKCTMGAYG
jgi:hypothetical protein